MLRTALAAAFIAATIVAQPPSRAAQAPRLLRDYRLRNTLADAAGQGPNLVAPDVVAEAKGYQFSAGKGFQLPNAGVSDQYTVELVCTLDETSGYRKLIDFRNRASDNGLYVYDGTLCFYPREGGGDLEAGHEYRIVLERDRSTREVKASVDGKEVFRFTDDPGDATPENGALLFFQDDTQTTGEESGGRVSRIRVWDAPGAATSDPPASPSTPAPRGVDGRRLVRQYNLRPALTDAAGDGPALRPVVPTPEAGALRFEAGHGFGLEDVGVTDDYALELSFSLDKIDGYRKLIDFKNRTQDAGLYVYNGALVFYGAPGSEVDILRSKRLGEEDEARLPLRRSRPPVAALVEPGHFYRVRITRSANSRHCEVHLEDRLALSFRDDEGLATFDNRIAYFFADDTATMMSEESGGTVSSLHIWGPTSKP